MVIRRLFLQCVEGVAESSSSILGPQLSQKGKRRLGISVWLKRVKNFWMGNMTRSNQNGEVVEAKQVVSNGIDILNEPGLSKLGQDRLDNANPLIAAIFARMGNMYSSDNPDGLINIGVAENSLMYEWLADYLAKDFSMEYEDFVYQIFGGRKELNKTLASWLTKHFPAIVPIKPEHLIIGTGVSSILDQVSSVMCNPGEGVMIATPYYNGFDNDFSCRSQLVVIGVDIPNGVDPSSPQIMDAFEEKYQSSIKSKGVTPKAVILCNPHNPLGFCHQRETILAYLRFCEKHNLHLISDEIYAFSIFKPKSDETVSELSGIKVERHPFISALSIDPQKEAQCNPARVHVVYGMSKDFCANGLRIGVLISQHNQRLLASLVESSIFMETASPSNKLWNKLLTDEESFSWFVNENSKRMGEAYDYVVEFLDKKGIPHYPSYCGHFIFIDLRKYLNLQGAGKPIEQEIKLFLTMLNDSNIFIAPGSAYHNPEAGWFRLTFVVRRDYLDVGLTRFSKLLDRLEEQDISHNLDRSNL